MSKKKCPLYQPGNVFYVCMVRCIYLGEDDRCTVKGVVCCPYWKGREGKDADKRPNKGQ